MIANIQISLVALGMAGLTLCDGVHRAGWIPQFFIIWGLFGYMSFLVRFMEAAE